MTETKNSNSTVADLIDFAQHFLPPGGAAEAFVKHWRELQEPLDLQALITDRERQFTAQLISTAIGTISPQSGMTLVNAFVDYGSIHIVDVLSILHGARQYFEFMQELVQSSIEHLSLGISVCDKNLRMVAWNREYMDLFDYPEGFVTVGRPVEDLIRFNGSRGEFAAEDLEQAVIKRLQYLREGRPYTYEREQSDGRVLELHGSPMPGGGYVTSYNDITVHKRLVKNLEESNETLEQRVAERTEELQVAKQEAEQANFSKTQFLAAASHDLMQPLNAAGLFASALVEQADGTQQEMARNIQSSLQAAESLLNSLLEVSRLDSGSLKPKITSFPIDSLMNHLDVEFTVLAQDKGLDFRKVPSGLNVRSDRHMLRRILQNLLSNAVRYTNRGGRILVGCRRRGDYCRIQVWDTGVGIPADKQQEIFQEFRRLNEERGERGLGLGLAITERISRLLDHSLTLRSWPGRGSVFSVDIPLADEADQPLTSGHTVVQPIGGLQGVTVLCIDNEPAVLQGMSSLLSGWQCQVLVASDLPSAQKALAQSSAAPVLMLADYQLDNGVTGIQVMDQLREGGITASGIVITATNTPAVRSESRDHGYQFLAKPVKPASLRALMNRLLN